MADNDRSKELARIVGTAACAGWWTLLAAFLLLGGLGVIFLFLTHTELVDVAAKVWRVGPNVVRITWVVFMGLLKLIFFVWALANLWLTIWARYLRNCCAAG
jgi:hypothetical protein